jgi:hypothetical protein
MEMDILEISIVDIGTYISSGNLRLGLYEPFQPSEVLDLKIFTFDSKIDKIVQEQVKKLLVTEGMPILVFTHVPVMGDEREDPIDTSYNHSWIQIYERQCRQHSETVPTE